MKHFAFHSNSRNNVPVDRRANHERRGQVTHIGRKELSAHLRSSQHVAY